MRAPPPRHADARARDALAFDPLPNLSWCWDGGQQIVVVVKPPNPAVDRLLGKLDGATSRKLPYDPRSYVWSHLSTHWYIPYRNLDTLRALLPRIDRLLDR
ncbi:hypothetical protein GAY28_36270 [Azospirillum brasilense]|nr:hypothetical protein [Azospirillum brasilense]